MTSAKLSVPDGSLRSDDGTEPDEQHGLEVAPALVQLPLVLNVDANGVHARRAL